jgi:uncharacterized YccA/Bax inhibitor family protein
MGQSQWALLGKALVPFEFAFNKFMRGSKRTQVAFGLTLLASLFLLLLLPLWTFELLFTQAVHEPIEDPAPVLPTQKGVVIVTAASTEKLVDFSGVDNFYQNMWNNRMSYANAHGLSPLSKS